MYSTNEIFARLQNGETGDVIANEMAQALNEALAKHEAETKKAKIQKKKMEDANVVAEVFQDYIVTYYPELGDVTIKGEDIDTILKGSVELLHSLDSLAGVVIDEKNVDNIIENFLRKMNLQ